MIKYYGACACGIVQFHCDKSPLFTQYCHCNQCRAIAKLSWNDADKKGYSWTAAYLFSNFKITAGIEHLYEKVRNHAKLFLCQSCHSLIYGISCDPTKQEGIGINMNLFKFEGTIPESFRPIRHIWYQNRIMNVEDDLPKFKDAPVEQFGSGVLWQEPSEQ